MKRIFLVVLLLFFCFGCATIQTDPRIDQLEAKVAKLERQMVMGMATGAGANIYPVTGGLIGGGTGALDKITNPGNKDVAIVALTGDATYGNAVFTYVFNSSGAETTDSLPWFVQPNDATSGDWELAGSSILISIPVTGALSPTAIQCRYGVFEISVANKITLPTAASVGFGNIVLVRVQDAGETAEIDLNGSEKFNISGTAQAAGVSITSPGAAGDWIALMAVTDADGAGGTDGYVLVGYGLTAWAAGS